MTEILTKEEFDDPQGRFVNYAATEPSDSEALAEQLHTDLRSFEPRQTFVAPYSMLDLDQMTMADLDQLDQEDLETGNEIVIQPGENWTNGTVGTQSDRHYWNGLTLACTTGENATESVMRDIDISGYGNSGYLSVACPALEVSKLNLAQCYVDLTSDNNGSFATDTVSLRFDQSVVGQSADDDTELRFPLSLLTGIDRTNVTGVRFRIQATANTSFRVVAVRVMASTWRHIAIDTNTLYGRVQMTTSRTGEIVALDEDDDDILYPDPDLYPDGGLYPSDGLYLNFPTAYKADLSNRANDPKPFDGSYGLTFYSGANTGTNHFDLVLRGETGIRFVTTWGDDDDPSIVVYDSEGSSLVGLDGFEIEDDTYYFVILSLVEQSVQIALFKLDPLGNLIEELVRHEEEIDVERIAGQVGWTAHFDDGNAYLLSIWPRGLNFGDIISSKAASFTPVDGVRLTVGASPVRELVNAVTSSPWGSRVTSYPAYSPTAYQVTPDSDAPLQGVASNWIEFDDFPSTEITFEINYPLVQQGGPLIPILFASKNRFIGLNMPLIEGGRWERVRIPLGDLEVQTGLYRIMLIQPFYSNEPWYIDNLSAKVEVVHWSARAKDPSDWMPLWDTINTEYSGVRFKERGRELQTKATALRHDAHIYGYTVRPRYTELGLHLTEVTPVGDDPDLPSVTTSDVGIRSKTFTINDPFEDGVIAYRWSFDDGSIEEFGVSVTHVFADAGGYDVQVTAIKGDLAEATQTVSVTIT